MVCNPCDPHKYHVACSAIRYVYRCVAAFFHRGVRVRDKKKEPPDLQTGGSEALGVMPGEPGSC